MGNITSFKKSIELGSNAFQIEGIPFIKVSNISKFGLSHPAMHLNRAGFNICQQSTKLIDIAKQAVKTAIEQNKEAALKFIKANTA